MIARDFEVDRAMVALGYVWYWADSTGAPLSEPSRAAILETFITSSSDTRFERRLGVAAGLAAAGDPALLSLARALRDAVRADDDGARFFTARLTKRVMPRLEQKAAGLSTSQLAERTRRLLRAVCTDTKSGRKKDACEPMSSHFDAALQQLSVGRTSDARADFEKVVKDADKALADAALSPAEHALIAGGVGEVLKRLGP